MHTPRAVLHATLRVPPPQVPALLAVGLEGCWGLVLCAVLLPLTTLVRGPDGLPLDDAPAAFRAILGNAELGGAVYLSIFSIAFFNFFGVSGGWAAVLTGVARLCRQHPEGRKGGGC